jgi:hypothetical protein
VNFLLVGERILGEWKFPKNPKPGFEAEKRIGAFLHNKLTERF